MVDEKKLDAALKSGKILAWDQNAEYGVKPYVLVEDGKIKDTDKCAWYYADDVETLTAVWDEDDIIYRANTTGPSPTEEHDLIMIDAYRGDPIEQEIAI